MKKALFLLFAFIFLSGCSVQKSMNPRIFLERLSDKTDSFVLENTDIFADKSGYICFVKDKNAKDFLFEFSVDKSENIKKISFSCIETEKAEDFVEYVKNIISVYSSTENADEIIMNLTENGKLKQGINYFENQWYLYCTNADKNGLFFSVTNKEMSEKTTVLYSLKPNDRVDF